MQKACSTHIPVLLNEVLEALNVQPGGRYIDATTGGGGHSIGILERSDPNGRVLGIDADPTALELAEKRMGSRRNRFQPVHGNFSTISDLSNTFQFSPVEGILMDLGLSSLQLEASNRGFSFLRDEPLDMRFDPTTERTAESLINETSLSELASIVRDFGEEPRANRIASSIVQSRPVNTSAQLAYIIKRTSRTRYSKLHPATKVFQALRIAVNEELINLKKGLESAASILTEGGRLVVIAYHSLEDRIVKEFFNSRNGNGFTPLSRKVIKPSREEVLSNRRSRSARLRCAEFSLLVN
ncbi:MAG: 16S rRNA (cytosine(1402)-N(4))-methyltransferase [Dehalococcoidia bacterium]|nr:16S rRNA (cytosine(1402)-N(4))-methyltransferase [Dehalococcoidia bacterium]|tara:strand:+ start:234 stop:1127 length:894 start_codon:yes stop_codon:yes gene_type:complete